MKRIRVAALLALTVACQNDRSLHLLTGVPGSDLQDERRVPMNPRPRSYAAAA